MLLPEQSWQKGTHAPVSAASIQSLESEGLNTYNSGKQLFGMIY